MSENIEPSPARAEASVPPASGEFVERVRVAAAQAAEAAMSEALARVLADVLPYADQRDPWLAERIRAKLRESGLPCGC